MIFTLLHAGREFQISEELLLGWLQARAAGRQSAAVTAAVEDLQAARMWAAVEAAILAERE